MADRWLTLADVYNPMDAMKVMEFKGRMDNSRIQNRLVAMQMAEMERKLGVIQNRNTLAAQYMTPAQPENAPQPGAEGPTMPGQPAKMDYQGYQNALLGKGDYEGAMGVQKDQQAQQKAQLEEGVKAAEIIHKLGGQKFKELYPALSELYPGFKKINPNLIKTDSGKTLYPATTPDGKTIPNTFIAYDDENKLHIVKGGSEAHNTIKVMEGGKPVVKQYNPETGQYDKTVGVAPQDGGMQLSPDAIKALGERFNITGEIPGMGMGRAATEARSKVLNKWAEDLNRTDNTVADQTAKQAAYKASKAELTKLQSQRGTVMAFANTAEKNLALVADLSEKVDRTGVPAINRWLLAGKRSLAGDPDVAKFDVAVRTAINEYAKVTSSATGGGVTSDQARKEVESMLNTAHTKEQVQQVIGLLRQEIGNRKTGYDEQIDSIKRSISGVSEGPATPNKPLPPGSKVINGVTYHQINGKWYSE